MGLSGRKVKQRIDNDPRNLTWADDATKFGQAYLSKLGWDPSKGLGATGDGMKSHITVTQRLNLLGIGAGAKQGAEDIAWKQNRDYEMVLKRLNAVAGGDELASVMEMEVAGVVAEGGFMKADLENEGIAKEEVTVKVKVDAEVKEKSKKKKRRKADEEMEDDGKENSDKRKKSKKRRKEQDEEPESSNEKEHTPVTTVTSPPIRAPIARPMAHRARFLKSKRMALDNPTAMLEILGVASSSVSPSTSSPSTPAADMSTNSSPGPESAFSSLTTSAILSGTALPTEKVPDSMEKLTTSTISMTDYFKEKLAAKSKPSPLSRGFSREDPDEELDAPRRGLGSSNLDANKSSGTLSSGVGLGSGMRFSALMGFAPSKTTDASFSEPIVPASDEQPDVSPDKGKEREKKKSKKKRDGSDKEKRCEQMKEAKMSGDDLDSQNTVTTSTEANDRIQEDDEVREKGKKKKKKSRTDDD